MLIKGAVGSPSSKDEPWRRRALGDPQWCRNGLLYQVSNQPSAQLQAVLLYQVQEIRGPATHMAAQPLPCALVVSRILSAQANADVPVSAAPGSAEFMQLKQSEEVRTSYFYCKQQQQ